MARGSVNKVTLLGNLGGDPEMRYMNNGDTVTTINLATTEAWRDKLSQDKKEQTEWHRVVVYGKLAEIVSKYAKKGSQLYIEGRLRTRRWVDTQNQNRSITEIIANEIHVLSNRATGEDWVGTEDSSNDGFVDDMQATQMGVSEQNFDSTSFSQQNYGIGNITPPNY